MLIIHLKSKFSSETVRVFAFSADKVGKNYLIELTNQTDTDKLEEMGFDLDFENLLLTPEEFVTYVLNIRCAN